MELKIQLLRDTASPPARATPGSVGYDLCAAVDEAVEIAPGATGKVPLGIAMEIPQGYGGFIFARSGLGVKHGIVPANCVGVIDSDYRGELIAFLYNHAKETYVIRPGERVAQLVILPAALPEVRVCDSLTDTQRGEGGFGSTGV